MRKLTALAVALSLSAAGQAFAGSSSITNALTGMNSSAAAIDAASNNIANAQTTGYKKDQINFSDVYAETALGGSGKNAAGGSATTSVSRPAAPPVSRTHLR